MIRIKALPSQHRAHALTSKFRGFSGPVGSGKTLWLCDHLLMLAYKNPGCTGLLGAPTYPMLRDASLKTMAERLAFHRIPYTFRKSEYALTLTEPKTTILCRAVENFDRLRGTNLAFFGLDETSFCPEKAWQQLEARMRDPKAREYAGCGAWTPQGFNWTYRRFIKDPLPGYKAVLANPRENTHLPPGFYESLTASYSPLFAKQEVLGEYLNIFSGRAYSSFDSQPGGHIWRYNKPADNYKGFAPCLYTRDRPVLWALDFNIDPATSVICQTVPIAPGTSLGTRVGGKNAQLNVIDEIYLRDANTYKHCEEFHNRVSHKQVPGQRLHVICYGDATGNRRQSSASRSDYQIMRDFFGRFPEHYTFDLRVPDSNPLVKDRVESVNSLCLNGNNQKRLVVSERCKELIADLEQVAWQTDSNGNLNLSTFVTKDRDRTHISDALGYLVHFEFALRSTIGGKPIHIH